MQLIIKDAETYLCLATDNWFSRKFHLPRMQNCVIFQDGGLSLIVAKWLKIDIKNYNLCKMNVNIIAPILPPPGGGSTSYSGLYGMRLCPKGAPKETSARVQWATLSN